MLRGEAGVWMLRGEVEVWRLREEEAGVGETGLGGM